VVSSLSSCVHLFAYLPFDRWISGKSIGGVSGAESAMSVVGLYAQSAELLDRLFVFLGAFICLFTLESGLLF